jgi:hypothetical protein
MLAGCYSKDNVTNISNSWGGQSKMRDVRKLCGSNGTKRIMREDLRAKIILGTTTADQVDQMFAKPCEEIFKNSIDQWEYYWAQQYTPFTSDVFALIIYLKNGIVQDYVFKQL